jgi:hypothetical protein
MSTAFAEALQMYWRTLSSCISPYQRINGWREDQMIFRLNEKEIRGTSAVNVVRALEREDKEYQHCGGSIRQYLSWSLNQLGGSVPARDLDISDRLEDEALALAYLVLLDEYGMGELIGPTETEGAMR